MVGVKEKDPESNREREREKVQFDGLTARFFKKDFFPFHIKHQALIEKPFSHGHDVKAVMRSHSSPGEAAE